MNYRDASLAHWMNNQSKIYIPSQCDIDLTNKCNQECYYCITNEFRHEQPVTPKYQAFEKLLQQLNTWREHSPNSVGTMQSITFSGGGEPTLLKGYENLIEQSIDYGFFTSLTTNGVLLNKLFEIDINKLRKMNWIGVDIDAGNPETYEKIRQSKTKDAFHKVLTNVRLARKLKLPVDFKVLVGEYNSSKKELQDIFRTANLVNIRMIYFRPVILANEAFDITAKMRQEITYFGEKYNVRFRINTTKTSERSYNRCHQMFNFPSFCADGNIYACCDHKGYDNFNIGTWDTIEDFRDSWLDSNHRAVYKRINTAFCPPCRSNSSNNNTQACLDDNTLLSVLHT